MPNATTRITVRVSLSEKSELAAMASNAGLSLSAFMRKAAAQEMQRSELFAAMLDQLVTSTERAGAAIDDALTYVEASNERIAAMESESLQSGVAGKGEFLSGKPSA